MTYYSDVYLCFVLKKSLHKDLTSGVETETFQDQ